jgi:uncharacterized protein (TIGR03435 family)
MRVVTLALPVLLLGPVIHSAEVPDAQAPAPQASLAFDVASVRQNVNGGNRGSRRSLPGGRLVIENMTLEQIITFAYGSGGSGQELRLTGGPAEILSRRFDITAAPPAGSSTTADDHPLMLRTLLAERFNLQTHTETHQMPVYALTVAREGRLGPGLRPSSHDCAAWAKAGGGMPENEPRDANDRPLCITGTLGGGPPGAARRRSAGPMSTLVAWAEGHLHDRPVVDMTGLTGNFEWEVTFSFDVTVPNPDNTAPSIFTAYNEQLGLRLEPRTTPMEVRVIDSVDLPTPN